MPHWKKNSKGIKQSFDGMKKGKKKMKIRDSFYLDAVTEQIVRVHSSNQPRTSFAVEEELVAEGGLRVVTEPDSEGTIVETDYLTICVDRDGRMKIYDKKKHLLCADYEGEQKTAAHELSEKELEQLRQEGHTVQNTDAMCQFRVVKQLFGGEVIYGLGDKTGFLNKKGYDYMMWNSDNPDPQVENPTFKAMYKTIPFFIVLRENAVYGIFLDNTYRSYFDMGFTSSRYYSFGAAGGELDYYFIGGDTIAEVLSNYTKLTGRAPLPQMWTLGYHQSRWSYASADEVWKLALDFRKYGIPCDAIHLDIDYMDDFKVFTANHKTFPDLQGLSGQLAAMGIKLVTIIDPGTKAQMGYRLYDEGIKNGYFAKDKDGKVYHNVVWPGDSVYPDFTAQKTRAWWGKQTERLTSQGIRGIWNDMNEPASFNGPLPDDVVFAGDGVPRLHEEVHNIYGHLMAKATYEGLKEQDGRRPFVITRACYSGSQKYSTAWTGDNQSIWAHLQMSIPQLLNLGMSGMPLVGTDIGGFGANTTPELLSRWIEASCFAPLFRNHSAKDTIRQEPWQFDEETLAINRKYIQLRYKYLPYLYDLCYEQTQTGLPILRPLVMHYQQDKNTWECNDEYLVGSQILVAPVTQQGARQRMVYLPEGVWVDYWTQERISGGRYILKEAPLALCPMYVKAGSILPVYEGLQSIEPEKITTLQLEYYPEVPKKTSFFRKRQSPAAESRYVHYQDNGVDFAYEDGSYNLYEFVFSSKHSSGLRVRMIQEGYDGRYQEIKAVVR
jgi:alpha-glucosidase